MKKNIVKKIFITSAISLLGGFILGYGISILLNSSFVWSSLIAPFIALIVGIVFPLVNIYFINKARLSIEISSISRMISPDTNIFMGDYSEFSVLNEYIYRTRRYFRPYNDDPRKEGALTIVELENFIDLAQQDVKELPSKIEKRKQELENITSVSLDKFNILYAMRLNQMIPNEIECGSHDDFERNKEKILESFTNIFQERVEELQKRLLDLQNSLPGIERKFETIRKDLTENKSYFTISTTLINSGRLSTSIKRPALLRVYIGQGNYVDLKLNLKKFETMSEIGAQSTKIAIFDSSEISALPEDDRKLINTYWGQSVSSVLYIEDINGDIHSSNIISFAEGLYQKLIYDRLSTIASDLLDNKL